MIPNIFHFVFGLAADFGNTPFSLAHYLAIKSAADTNKPSQIIFHYEFEPSGEWWERTKPLLTLNKIEAPGSFMGRPLIHIAHKADIVRLLALKETGGIYLDMDTICSRSMHELFNNNFVIGQELRPEKLAKNWRQRIKFAVKEKIAGKAKPEVAGLCNAVLLSEKNSDFINLWLDSYGTFRSEGRDKYWNEHSVFIPAQLAKANPDKISIVGPYAFHFPLYDKAGMALMFEKNIEFPGAYAHHLWESFSWKPYLSQLTEKNIREQDTSYNCIARRFL